MSERSRFSNVPWQFMNEGMDLTLLTSSRHAIKNAKGDKEDRKDFQLFHPSSFVDGLRFYCNGCDASMKVLFAFLQHVRGKL